MFKQAAILALNETMKMVDKFGGKTGISTVPGNSGRVSEDFHHSMIILLKERACMGIILAKALLEAEPPVIPYHEYYCSDCDCYFGVSRDFEDQISVKCPICGTDEHLQGKPEEYRHHQAV